jgi:hypothetical protein
VPLRSTLLLCAKLFGPLGAIVLVELDTADSADLGIIAAAVALRVEKRVDVQTGRSRPASQLSQAENERLLQFVGEIVLGAEEDDAALRN